MKSKMGLGEVLGKWTQEPVPDLPNKKPVLVKPSFDVPLPPSYPRKEEVVTDLKEGVRAAANTAKLLNKLGMSEDIDITEGESETPVNSLDPTHIFQQAFGMESTDVQMVDELTGETKRGPGRPKKPNGSTSVVPTELFDTYTAVKLATILSEYDKQVIDDTAQLRTYITNRLIEESKCGDTKHEIRALELLGKISDVGLFSEKTEINITHTTDSLQHAIKDKIDRLMGMVGSNVQDAEFEEVELEEVELEEIESEVAVDEEGT